MTNLPEDQLHEPTHWIQDGEAAAGPDPSPEPAQLPVAASPVAEVPAAAETSFELTPGVEESSAISTPAAVEPQLFQTWSQPEVPPPVRVPHLGHLLLLCMLIGVGFLLSIAAFFGAIQLHFFGVKTMLQASSDIHFLLGTEALIYLVAFGLALAVFPPFWHKNLFAGLQWNGATAIRLKGRLVSAAILCFLLAWLNSVLIPSPTNTPIEKMFKTPGAAWLLFGFGVTFAPFFEEMFFRGFLLPALCTAYDWIVEKIKSERPLPLLENGHPQWSVAAMIVGSVATSIPFAALHAEQTGYGIGPFLLLVGVSLVLCGVRLLTRSLASSTMVHACYNFLLFSLMLIGTEGFRHMDKM
ncbi:MAG: lysostaphin resistance A-like protein [Terracidiphilus sp.]